MTLLMTRPRRLIAGTSYLITRRVTQRKFLLTPTDDVVQVFLYVLGYVASRRPVSLHAYCLMSDHVHLVLTDLDGSLPEFTRDFASLMARVMNQLRERRENFWSGEKPSYVDLVETEDLRSKMVYTMTNPVAAGLVRQVEQWKTLEEALPAASSVRQVCGDVVRIQRPDRFLTGDPYPKVVELRLSPPPCCLEELELLETSEADSVGAPLEEFRQQLQAAVHERERDLAEAATARGQGFLGMKRVCAQDPETQPASDGYSNSNPKMAATDRESRKARLAAMAAFYEAYHEARTRFLSGDRDVVFPVGTFYLRVRCGVRCEPQPEQPAAAFG